MSDRVPCEGCGVEILPATFKQTEGVCRPCEKARARAELLARHGDPIPRFRLDYLLGKAATKACLKLRSGVPAGTVGVGVSVTTQGENKQVASRNAEAMLLRWISRRTGQEESSRLRFDLERYERLDPFEHATRYVDLDLEHLRWLSADDVLAWKAHGVVEFPSDQLIEDRLVELTLGEISTLIALCEADPPVGFAFDCNSDGGHVLVSICSMAAAERIVGKKTRGPDDLRWRRALSDSLGDWDGLGINLRSTAWDAGWESVRDQIASALQGKHASEAAPQAMSRRFMDAATRAFARVVAAESFARFKGTGHPVLWVSDHCESRATTLQRLRKHGINF